MSYEKRLEEINDRTTELENFYKTKATYPDGAGVDEIKAIDHQWGVRYEQVGHALSALYKERTDVELMIEINKRIAAKRALEPVEDRFNY